MQYIPLTKTSSVNVLSHTVVFPPSVIKSFAARAAPPPLTIHFPFSLKTHRFLSVSAPFRRHDDGGGVGLSEADVSVGQRGGAEGPGCVHVTSHDALQLRDPLPHIVTLNHG